MLHQKPFTFLKIKKIIKEAKFLINYVCTSEILNTANLTPYNTISTTQYPFSILYLPTQI